jgi:Kef-type K+ transport system membrane component KefB
MVVGGDLFIQVGFIIIAAAIFGYILRLLKQPQLIGYVLVGILITPIFNLITDSSLIDSLSIIGIAFLLFIVGLEMDLKSLRSVMHVAVFGGILQVLILFITGYLVMLLLGFLSLEAAYVGLMLAFSSTMVVMKLLSDRRELSTLHGRIAVGFLLVQDIIAIFALSILGSVNGFSIAFLGLAFLKLIGIFIIAYIISKFAFPHIFRFAARNQELLLVSSLAVCFLFSLAFNYLGFSVAIGAFVAGVSLGNLRYNIEIIAKMKSLKDFFALLFFVALGMGISLSVIKQLWLPLIVLLVIIMVFKPLVIMLVCSLFKYTKKPSFLTSNALAQVGEFSLILATQGLLLGHLSQDLFSLVVIVTVMSIVLTSYYIQYNSWFYKILKRPLKVFDYFTTEGLEYLPTKIVPSVVLCGHNRIGYSILKKFHKTKKEILIVDFNPEVIHRMVQDGFHCLYGDATDDEILEHMHLKKIKIFISTLPRMEDNFHMMSKLKEVNKKAKIIVTASGIDEAMRLYKHGANYVIMPHFLGGEHVSDLVSRVRRKKVDLKVEKKKHINELKERQDIGHDHPFNFF